MQGRILEMGLLAIPQERVEPTDQTRWWSDEGLMEILGMVRGAALVLLVAASLCLFGHHVANWW